MATAPDLWTLIEAAAEQWPDEPMLHSRQGDAATFAEYRGRVVTMAAGLADLGVLRGGGDTRFAMIVDLVGSWAIALPVAFVCGLVLHWPAYIVYMSAIVSGDISTTERPGIL